VGNRVPATFVDIGEQNVKNIAQPVRAFRVSAGGVPVPGAPQTASPRARQKSIAVLAFANLSDDKSNEYFSDGISEELLDILAKLPGLKVAARTSTFHFKGKQAAVADIARQLDVAYVVDGSVRKSGERVRVSVQLVEAEHGSLLWSRNFDRDLKDVFAVQSEVAIQIAKNLKITLDAASLVGSGTASEEAWQLFLQGTRAPLADGDDLVHKALALDPRFVRAHLALAGRVHVRARESGAYIDPARAPAVLEQVIAHANDVLRLDAGASSAHVIMSYAQFMSGQTQAAMLNVRRALQLNPNNADAHDAMAGLLLLDGRMTEALAERRRNIELDPLQARRFCNYADLLLLAGRPAEALEALDRALALDAESADAQAARSCALLHLGRRDEALALARQIAGRAPSWHVIEVLASVGTAGDLEEMERQHTLAPDDSAYLALRRGRNDAFLELFDARPLDPELCMAILFSPAWDGLRDTPQFLRWLDRNGLANAHARAQAWRAANPPLSTLPR